MLLAACAGDAEHNQATLRVTTTTAAPTTTTTTTIPPTTTTVPETTTTVEVTTTLPPAPEPVMPLTGLPVADGNLASRPALVVKVSNDRAARPQSGLNQADVIYEAWGSGPTRFATVWQSQDAAEVGPIRSGRTQDVDLVGPLIAPLFACSGGNPRVVDSLRNSDLILLTEGTGPGWYLKRGRRRPHATYNSTAQLYTNAPEGHPPPPPLFSFRAPGAEPVGEPINGVDLRMQQVRVSWRWDPATNTYARDQDGRAHLLADGQQVTTNNVILQYTDYQPSFADRRSPDATSIGGGRAVVFTDGRMIEGAWHRDDRLEVIHYLDANGAAIQLTPGRTFVEMPNTGEGDFRGTPDEMTPVP